MKTIGQFMAELRHAQVRVWDVWKGSFEQGKTVLLRDVPSDPVDGKARITDLAYTRDGAFLVTASAEGVGLVAGVCVKYRRSGGGWSFLAGISRPSALRK